MATTSAIALFFAVAFLGLRRARIHLKARAKRFEENKKAAWVSLQLGFRDLPSWMAEEETLSEFLFAVQRLALRKGIPHREVLKALANEHCLVQLVSYAEALELRRATLAEQELAVAEAIAQRFNYEQRMRAEAGIFFSDCGLE